MILNPSCTKKIIVIPKPTYKRKLLIKEREKKTLNYHNNLKATSTQNSHKIVFINSYLKFIRVKRKDETNETILIPGKCMSQTGTNNSP